MFFLTYGEKGPRVVLVQALLRLSGIDVRINGYFDRHCLKAVEEFRGGLGLRPMGPIDSKVFFSLLQRSRIKLIDSVDASGGFIAGAAQHELDATAGKGHTLMNERVPGRGVAHAVDKIVARANGFQIGMLRIIGHGNEGAWISVALGNPHELRTSGRPGDMEKYNALKADWGSYIDNNHFERHRATLSRISPFFTQFASAEIHSCMVGAKQQEMIQKLADTWGVPVTAGKGLQRISGTYRNEWGEIVPYTFVMEGDLFRAYPNGGNLQNWAASVEASIPNLIHMINQAKKNIKEKMPV